MTITEMLQQSGILTVLGMTVVFIFLWIMIICMSLMHKLIRAMKWDKDVTMPKNDNMQKTGKTIPPEHVSAISAAVTEYQKKE